MYQIPYFALAGLLVTFGVPVALMEIGRAHV